MRCINCNGKTAVIETASDEDVRFRKRKCKDCGMVMFTVEDLVPFEMDERMRKAFANRWKD